MCSCSLFWPPQAETHSEALCTEEVMQWSPLGRQPEPNSTLEAPQGDCGDLITVVDMDAPENQMTPDSERKTPVKTQFL